MHHKHSTATQGQDFTNRVCSREYIHVGFFFLNKTLFCTNSKGRAEKKNMKIHNPQHALIKQSNAQFIKLSFGYLKLAILIDHQIPCYFLDLFADEAGELFMSSNLIE